MFVLLAELELELVSAQQAAAEEDMASQLEAALAPPVLV
jgi:hypothetical protein